MTAQRKPTKSELAAELERLRAADELRRKKQRDRVYRHREKKRKETKS